MTTATNLPLATLALIWASVVGRGLVRGRWGYRGWRQVARHRFDARGVWPEVVTTRAPW